MAPGLAVEPTSKRRVETALMIHSEKDSSMPEFASQFGDRFAQRFAQLFTRFFTQRRGPSAFLVGLTALLLIAGCNSRGDNSQSSSATDNPNKGDWLCEAGKAADDWDCIQTENIEPLLAERQARRKAEPAASSAAAQAVLPDTPQPLLDPAAPPLPGSQALPSPAEQTAPEPSSVPELSVPELSAPEPSEPEPAEPPPLTTASPERNQEPAYAALAYRPDEPVRIIDLPEDFYAAQLLAVSTKAQIENFVIEQDLYNMSAARIEREGQILYVLLLGVYETKDRALSAVQQMPDAVRVLKPWVRPIDGLQDAMVRADRLTATAKAR